MSSYNYSYNVLINRFEAFAAGHLLIKRFTHGQIDLSDQLNDDQYPFMHVTPDTIEPTKGAIQFGFHVMFADIPRDKETKAEYQREVISDCVRLGQDLIAEIQNGLELFGFNVQLVNNVVFEPFMEEQKNTVTGVAFTVKLEVPWDWSACDIPAVWAVGGESTGGSGSPIGLLLQVNGVNNTVQSELDLVAGTNVTLTDNGDGSVTIAATGGGGGGSGTVTSVALTAPAAFNVSGSPVTTSGTLAITAAGDASEYIDGSGALQTFPTIPTELNDLTDVNVQSPANGEALLYFSGGNEFKNAPIATVATTGDYNDLSNLPTIPTNLDDLADVNAPTPTNGQVLTYNSTSGDWEAQTPAAVTGYVPYTGATQDVNLGEFGIQLGNLEFDITPTNIPATQGSVYWDDNAETLALIMNGTTQKVGEDIFYHVRNTTGSTIPKGTAVRFAGTTGNSGRLLIAPMLADGTYPSTYYMGVTSEALTNNTDGKVYHFGKMRGVNTNAYNDGDILYVSTTVAGGFQTTMPAAPNNIIVAAAVVHAANNGTLMIRPTLGSNINSDEGVLITSVANRDLLIYNSATSLWENDTLTTGDLPTGIDAANIGTGNVSNTEFGYLDGVTSAIQTQLNNKKDTISFAQVYTATVIASSTVYAAVGGIATYNGTESNRQMVSAVGGIIKDFYASISTIQSATGSLTINIRKNGVNTGISVTFTNADGATATKSDTTNTVSISAGDKISFQLINGATAASAQVQSMAFIIDRS